MTSWRSILLVDALPLRAVDQHATWDSSSTVLVGTLRCLSSAHPAGDGDNLNRHSSSLQGSADSCHDLPAWPS